VDSAISSAWKTAGSELGIEVVAPFGVVVGNRDVEVEAYISNFGGPKGTVVLSESTSKHQKELSKLGYYVSILFPSYRRYSRQHFVDTLDDWQWFGDPVKCPSWYTGKPWT